MSLFKINFTNTIFIKNIKINKFCAVQNLNSPKIYRDICEKNLFKKEKGKIQSWRD